MPEPDQLGGLIALLVSTRNERQECEKRIEQLTKQIGILEDEIIHAMDDLHLDKATYAGTTVAPRQHTYAHVEDWAMFYDFIEQEKYWHLLEKRVSVTGYRELLELGREVPGVVPFLKTKLSVTKSAR